MSSTQKLVWIYNMYFTSSEQELVEICNWQKSEKLIINLLRVSYYTLEIPTNIENTTYNNAVIARTPSTPFMC